MACIKLFSMQHRYLIYLCKSYIFIVYYRKLCAILTCMLVTPPTPLPPSPPAPDSISALNDSANLDFRTVYANLYRDFDLDNNPYSNVVLSSNYYDMYSLSTQLREHDSPLFLSINIQSLNSKYKELCTQIIELQKQKSRLMLLQFRKRGKSASLMYYLYPVFSHLYLKLERK